MCAFYFSCPKNFVVEESDVFLERRFTTASLQPYYDRATDISN